MKSKATGFGSISTVFSSKVLLCVSIIMMIILIIIIITIIIMIIIMITIIKLIIIINLVETFICNFFLHNVFANF